MASLLTTSIRCRGGALLVSSRARITGAHRPTISHHRTYYFNHHHRHIIQSSLRCFATNSGGDDDILDDEWIHPDDSPLSRRNTSYNSADDTAYSKSPARPAEAQDEEVVEVIDLAATLNNQSNQYLLKDDTPVDDASEYEVHASNVEWDDILTDLKESGEDEMLLRLVQEYGLQDRLKVLEDTPNQKQSQTNNQVLEKIAEEDEEDWLYEEESFEGLSDEDIIDELIENSPSLSQLELEILSQELKRSEEDG
eukprot:scaffold6086_cov116-Skeletonema_marinoi.AAC.1